jgi:hypothetical protein
MALLATRIHAILKLIHHHALEDIALVINIRKNVFPEDVQDGRVDHEAVDAHPEPVGEGGEGEGDDEDGEEGGDEDDEGFGRYEVEPEPEDPGEEGGGGGLEAGEPVGDDGEEDGYYDCGILVCCNRTV